MAAKPVPDGFTTITPHIVVKGGSEAIGFYKKAFGAEEIVRVPGPDGKSVMHAELQIGNARLLLHDEMPGCGGGPQAPSTINGTSLTIHLYVEDVDAVFKKAVGAGGKETMPVTDMFWGDRYGVLVDPFGHHWGVATHKQDLTPEQIGKAAEEFFAQMGSDQHA